MVGRYFDCFSFLQMNKWWLFSHIFCNDCALSYRDTKEISLRIIERCWWVLIEWNHFLSRSTTIDGDTDHMHLKMCILINSKIIYDTLISRKRMDESATYEKSLVKVFDHVAIHSLRMIHELENKYVALILHCQSFLSFFFSLDATSTGIYL